MTVGVVKMRLTVICSNMNSFNVFVLGKVEVLWKVGPKNQNNKKPCIFKQVSISKFDPQWTHSASSMLNPIQISRG